MKYVIALFAGLAVGVGSAVAVLYYNPLTTKQAATSRGAADLVLSYGFPQQDSIALTHNEQMDLPTVPDGISRLWESTISNSALSVLKLRNPDGAVTALATRVSVPSAETDLLLRGAIVSDYWLITLPGEGSFAVYAANNHWPFIKDAYIPVRYLGRAWSGPSRYEPTVGPSARRTAVVTGGTGRFASLRGDATEVYELKRLSNARGVEELTAELRLSFAAPAEPAAAADVAQTPTP